MRSRLDVEAHKRMPISQSGSLHTHIRLRRQTSAGATSARSMDDPVAEVSRLTSSTTSHAANSDSSADYLFPALSKHKLKDVIRSITEPLSAKEIANNIDRYHLTRHLMLSPLPLR